MEKQSYIKDSNGKSLRRRDAETIAGYLNFHNAQKMTRNDLLVAITKGTGVFDEEFVYSFGIRFKDIFLTGDTVSPKAFRSLFGGMSLSPDHSYVIGSIDSEGRYSVNLSQNVCVPMYGKDLNLVTSHTPRGHGN